MTVRELTIQKARRVAIGPLKVKRTVLVDVSLKRSRYHITTGNFAADISPIDDRSNLNYNVIRQQKCHAGGNPDLSHTEYDPSGLRIFSIAFDASHKIYIS